MPKVEFSDAAMAARFDFWIRAYGQTVSVYDPDRTVALGIATENMPSLVGTAICMIQFGEEVIDMMSGAGVNPNKFTVGYFVTAARSMIKERRYLLDAEGGWWLIHSWPASQPMPGSIGVYALLERQVDSPLTSPTT